MNYMETPLIGTREQNYKYFYVTGCASIASNSVGCDGIHGVRVDVCGLFNDMNEIILDVKLMIPDIRDSLRKRCADTRILRKGKICY